MRDRLAVSTAVIAIVVVLLVAVVAAVLVLGSSSPQSTTSSGTGNTSGTASSTGALAVMATDPPYAPGTNSHEYEHYNNVEAHRSPSGSSSGGSSGGWVKLNASGTLELNSLVNSSQTAALANIQAGGYDSVRFVFDSAIVTYNGKNYTAQMGSATVAAGLGATAQVSGSATTAVLFDLRTVAVNVGSTSSPQFVMTSSARAEAVPSGDTASASLQVGARTDLSTSAWFRAFADGNARLQVTGASISSSSLSITAKNSGSEAANVTYVVVTPTSLLVSVGVVIPDSIQGSAVFMVGADGSLQSSTSLLAQIMSPGAYFSIGGSGSGTMKYSGNMTFAGAGGALGVTAGQSYLITVVGVNSVTSTTVTAT